MTLSEAEMKSILEQAPKSKESAQRAKLLRMLRSMSRKYPSTRLLTMSDGFGVLLDDGDFLRITLSGRWSQERTREFLVLFAMWCDVDYARLIATQQDGPHGALFMELGRFASSSGVQD